MKKEERWMFIQEEYSGGEAKKKPFHLSIELCACICQILGVFAVLDGIGAKFYLDYEWQWLLGCVVIVCIADCILQNLVQKVYAGLVLGLIVTFAMCFISDIRQVLLLEWDVFRMQIWNEIISYFNINQSAGTILNLDTMNHFWILLALWFACISGIFFYQFRSAVGAAIVLLANIFLAMTIGKMPTLLDGICLLLSIIGLRLLERIPENELSVERFWRNLLISIMMVVLSICLAFAAHRPSFNWFSQNKTIYMKFRERIDEVNVNKLIDNITCLATSYFPAEAGMSGGSINRSGKWRETGQIDLRLTLEGMDYEETLYLRAYTGNEYTSRGWGNQSGTLEYTQEDWQKIAGVSYQLMGNLKLEDTSYLKRAYLGNMDNYWTDIHRGATYNCSQAILEIQVLNANKNYKYLGYYGLEPDSDADLFMDAYVTGGNQKNYYTYVSQMEMVSDSMDFEPIYYMQEENYPDNLVWDIRAANEDDLAAFPQEYIDWVQEIDLQIPEKIFDTMIERMQTRKAERPDMSYADALQIVREELADCEYSVNTSKVPWGRDPIEYFLNEGKKGYCVYFASAATLMFRALGIPARYVEGYVIDGLKMNVVKYVKDSCAHAWVEIFDENIGWIPMEVTPNYYEERGWKDSSENEQQTASSGEAIAIIAMEETLENTMQSENQESSSYTSGESEVEENPSETLETNAQHDASQASNQEKNQLTMVRKQLKIGCYLGIICFVLWLIWRIFLQRIRFCKHKRRQCIYQGNQKKKVLELFEQIKRLCRYAGLYVDEYTEGITEKMPFLVEEDYQKMVFVILKATFSNQPIEEEEADVVVQLFLLLESQVIEKGFCVKKEYKILHWLRWQWNRWCYALIL